LLGEEEHCVGAREQATDEDARGERRPRHTQRPAACEDDRGHDRARRDEARRHREQRRDRLHRDRDEEGCRAPEDVDGPERRPHLRPPTHRDSESAAPAARRARPRSLGQVRPIWSTPKSPYRSMTAPITSWPAIRIPIVAVAPIRGCANVIENTTMSPISPPIHIQGGAEKALPSRPVPWRATS